MNRRRLLLFTGTLLVAPSILAQPARRYRVGWFASGIPADSTVYVDAFRARMEERGYVEGRNLIIDIGFGESDARRFSAVAEDLIKLRPDVLIGVETSSRAMAAKTRDIPIVLTTSIDPVGAGLVKSLARPGTNVTGMVDLYDQLIAKHIELLVELVPKASRLGLLIDPDWTARKSYEEAARKAAGAKRLNLTVAEIARAADVPMAFAAFEKQGAQILLISTQPRMVQLRREILDGIRRLRMPSIFGIAAYPEGGGLLSYGPSLIENMRQVAELVDRIFKGAKPADLPLRQTTKYELVVNLKAAREIGLTIPQAILFRADRVIE